MADSGPAITRVVLRRDGTVEELSLDGFLALPLNQRIELILERAVEFYAGDELIERQTAMKLLRTARK